MSLLIFLIVLSVLIVVHEAGHFIMARSLGVQVERFALGFGPTLFARRIKGTEFALCAIPLGGYVKMAGDERNSCKGEQGEFYSQSPGHRSLIVLMGPAVNYVLAYLCLCVVFMIGYPTVPAKIGTIMDGYPAKTAGLKVGDQILSIDSQSIQSWEDVQKFVAKSKAPALQFIVLRSGQQIEKTIVPTVEKLENIFGQKEDIRLVGIRPPEEVILLTFPFAQSIQKAWERLWDITTTTYKALYRMATGAMSAKDSMTGPIGIFFIIQKAAEMGFSYLLYVVGVISASLAIFNLLPLPVLDGGHLFLSGLEKLRGKPLSQKTDETIARVGLSLIICLAVFVFYSDFARYGWIDKIVGFWQK